MLVTKSPGAGRAGERGRSALEETLMPPGGPPIRPNEPVEGLWCGILWAPTFGGLFIAATFAGRAGGPAWEVWALRAFMALFFGLVGSGSAARCFRELRRRGNWVPPGA